MAGLSPFSPFFFFLEKTEKAQGDLAKWQVSLPFLPPNPFPPPLLATPLVLPLLTCHYRYVRMHRAIRAVTYVNADGSLYIRTYIQRMHTHGNMCARMCSLCMNKRGCAHTILRVDLGGESRRRGGAILLFVAEHPLWGPHVCVGIDMYGP
jgi:hypothetical protein